MKLAQCLVFCFFCMALASCHRPISYPPELTAEETLDEEVNQQVMVDEDKARGGSPKRWRNHKNMRGQFETVGGRIEKAGAEICRGLHLERHGCYYYFKMSRNEEINSMADGKNIIIYTGMIRFVESDDELAAVMGHEFAHNLMGHPKAQKKNATWGGLAGLAADAIAKSQGIDTGGEIAENGEEFGALAYSIDFEKEADYIGLYVMERAGYNIKLAPNLWRRMSLEDPDGINIAITHPSNAQRFVALQKTIDEIEFKKKNHIKVLPDFKMVPRN